MTGLIYLVIIALWAAVLIPMWLRRHDQISEVRSTARFSSAMRSLGSHDEPAYAMHANPAYALSTPTRGSFEEAPMAPTGASRRTTESDRRREEAHRRAATRRAIVLGVLTAFVLVTLVAAMLGAAPKWAPILAALPAIAFVVATAMTASERSSAKAPARATRPARAPRSADAESAAAPSPALEQTEEEWENWNAWDDDDSWEAVPTTLPTYVDAPRASAVPRGIDRATPGEWTGSAMVETAQAMRSRRPSEPLPDASEIDHHAATAEIPVITDDYDARRAVNE